MTRRESIGRILRVVWVPAVLVAAGRRSALAQGDRERLMQRALELRRLAVEAGDQPYGAVVARDGRIVGEGPSRVLTHRDPTAHAEMEAVRDAARRLGTRDLGGCEIYASSRPCRMCEAACYWANVSRMYFGAEVSDAGAPRLAC